MKLYLVRHAEAMMTVPKAFPLRKGAVLALEADGKGTIPRLADAAGG